ncbi:(2Fe-2S)-binding protein [Ferroglobus sp.]|uniref:(2Fe-2S)-binding protein n=1 Tax=Ferroglobus sp. TaxID=2614230 RepID=UPI0025C29D29|nr:(2Fe-2S)-binding protein [Ferroglobus sp.]
MKSRKIVCRCEDITEEEIIHAIEEGYDDIESLKRYTGATTGACQGKGCLMHILRILSQKTGKSPEEIGITTQRPPVNPVPFYVLAEGEKE